MSHMNRSHSLLFALFPRKRTLAPFSALTLSRSLALSLCRSLTHRSLAFLLSLARSPLFSTHVLTLSRSLALSLSRSLALARPPFVDRLPASSFAHTQRQQGGRLRGVLHYPTLDSKACALRYCVAVCCSVCYSGCSCCEWTGGDTEI